ncbi:hypothetical protein Q1W73_16500 [Asticcacaulis sp. ZE23SCel15]|uniref:hypothetical protein n=1 Tax=Asticcacaulis sp. ZE23SCel15 TaxID=3059027 RepID=UPI00265E4D40|nr:hypothetical protein [Asticcacaulis sp. ZE23SCel15]WKL57244.1 hypothetical protein Q1W73_16500 [Asticcacaulis sp. ZE23SCel15]
MIALCLGGARGVWDEYRVACDLVGDAPHRVVACNFAGVMCRDRIDAWVSLHPEYFDGWRADRRVWGGNQDYQAFSGFGKASIGLEIVRSRWFGSSGLYMAQIATERLGADKIILCGVPMNDRDGHIHWSGEWDHAYHYRDGFLAARGAGLNMKSMSGWTRELFGAPDYTWLSDARRKMEVATHVYP